MIRKSAISALIASFAVFLSAGSAQAQSGTLIAQAKKPSPRAALAKEIQSVAYKFAENPEDYALVQQTDGLMWKMILMSEGLSSCSIPVYSLVQNMEGLNAMVMQLKNSLDSLPANTPQSVRDQVVAGFEGSLNGYKKKTGIILESVMKYCK